MNAAEPKPQENKPRKLNPPQAIDQCHSRQDRITARTSIKGHSPWYDIQRIKRTGEVGSVTQHFPHSRTMSTRTRTHALCALGTKWIIDKELNAHAM